MCSSWELYATYRILITLANTPKTYDGLYVGLDMNSRSMQMRLRDINVFLSRRKNQTYSLGRQASGQTSFASLTAYRVPPTAYRVPRTAYRLPIQAYFARVSALHWLGYGARRNADPMDTGATSTGGMRVPYQVIRRLFTHASVDPKNVFH